MKMRGRNAAKTFFLVDRKALLLWSKNSQVVEVSLTFGCAGSVSGSC
jgi:hypothetical protein